MSPMTLPHVIHVIHTIKNAMNLPDTITFHGGPAVAAEARNLDLFEFTLDGASYVDQNVPAKTEAHEVVVNVVGLSDAGNVSGWVLLLG